MKYKVKYSKEVRSFDSFRQAAKFKTQLRKEGYIWDIVIIDPDLNETRFIKKMSNRAQYVADMYGRDSLITTSGKAVVFKRDQINALPAVEAWFEYEKEVQL